MSEKFVRTESGCIWELGDDNCYHKPSCINTVSRDHKSVVDASDEMYKLVKIGDIVKTNLGFVAITEKHIQKSVDGISTGYISSSLNFCAVYTPSGKKGLPDSFELEAIKVGDTWTVK